VNARAFALGFAFVLPLTFIGTADAAPAAPTGSIVHRVDLVPVGGYQAPTGTSAASADNAYFSVTASGLKRNMLRVGLDCRATDGSVTYAGTRTVYQGDVTDYAFTFTMYNTTRQWADLYGLPYWDAGEVGLCNLHLFYETFSRKSGYAFGGTLDYQPGAFWIGQ